MRNLRIFAVLGFALFTAGVARAQPVEEAWVDRYDGVGDGIDGGDRGFSVAYDSQGNIVVGGFSKETQGGTYMAIKYAPDGTRNWVSTATPLGGLGLGWRMTLDNADNVIVVGSAGDFGSDFGIVKYDAAGDPLWSKTYPPGSGAYATFDGVATDGTGAIYAYGNYGATSSLPGDIILVKYAADGTFLWDLVYPSAQAAMIAVGDGGVYLVGAARVAFRDDDLLVLKVTPSGTVDWGQTFGRSGEFAADLGRDLAFDSSGNVVAAGSFSGIFGNPEITTDFAVVRLAPDGTLLSETAYDGPLAAYNEGRRLVLDADDNAIVAGMQTDPTDAGGSYDIQIVKLDPAGNPMWDRTYGGLDTFTDIPYDMAIDHLGGVYIVAETWSKGPIRELLTMKYDAAGTPQWTQLYGGAGFDPTYPAAVAVGPDLRVAVTGYSAGLGPFRDDDAVTLCYTQPGPVGVGDSAAHPLVMGAAPNPFDGSTSLSMSLRQAETVDLTIYDLAGRRVRTLSQGQIPAGDHLLRWDGRDQGGRALAAGVYFARLRAGIGSNP